MSTPQSHPEPSNTGSNPRKTAGNSKPLPSSLERLGYDERVRANGEEFVRDEFFIARVVQVNKRNYKVCDGRQDRIAEVSGKVLFTIETPLD